MNWSNAIKSVKTLPGSTINSFSLTNLNLSQIQDLYPEITNTSIPAVPLGIFTSLDSYGTQEKPSVLITLLGIHCHFSSKFNTVSILDSPGGKSDLSVISMSKLAFLVCPGGTHLSPGMEPHLQQTWWKTLLDKCLASSKLLCQATVTSCPQQMFWSVLWWSLSVQIVCVVLAAVVVAFRMGSWMAN